jgi:large subunit ribosomal protein L31e
MFRENERMRGCMVWICSGVTILDDVLTRWFLWALYSTFKKMAPKAVKDIRKFAQKTMGTGDVRLDVKLNKHLWSRGVRNVPTRVRVRIARKRNDDEDAKDEFYSYVSVAEVPAEGFRNLGTKVTDDLRGIV